MQRLMDNLLLTFPSTLAYAEPLTEVIPADVTTGDYP